MPGPAPRIAVQLIEPLFEWMAANGLSAQAELESRGVSLPRAAGPGAMIPLAAYVEMFEHAARAGSETHLGLKLGRFDEPGNLGALGYLFMSGASLLDAYEGFCAHLDALQDDTTIRLQLDGNAVTFQYRINDEDIVRRRQDSEYSVSAMHNLTRLYSDGQVGPRLVCFEHRQAGRYAAYRDFFGCDVYFEQPFNALVYRREGFNVRSRRRTQLLNPILTSHLDALSAGRASPRSFRGRVVEFIDLHLADATCSQARIARELGVSISTLIRRLHAEGANFRELLAERRLHRAERLLLEEDAPVASVALAVGYSETASFSRAFRRRKHQSPAAFRRTQRRKR